MNAGKLNKRIRIEQQAANSPAKDEFGAPSYSWGLFKEVWAEITPVSGREFWAQQQAQSEITHRIRIRYLSGVLATMRITFGSRIFAIKHIIDTNERHRELVIMCVEGTRDG